MGPENGPENGGPKKIITKRFMKGVYERHDYLFDMRLEDLVKPGRMIAFLQAEVFPAGYGFDEVYQ
jgi:hypothetical protein